MPAANAPAPGYMAPTGLPAIHLLEAMVFAHRCYLNAVEKIDTLEFNEAIPDWKPKAPSPKEMILITQSLKELQLLMSDYVGIVRNK